MMQRRPSLLFFFLFLFLLWRRSGPRCPPHMSSCSTSPTPTLSLGCSQVRPWPHCICCTALSLHCTALSLHCTVTSLHSGTVSYPNAQSLMSSRNDRPALRLNPLPLQPALCGAPLAPPRVPLVYSLVPPLSGAVRLDRRRAWTASPGTTARRSPSLAFDSALYYFNLRSTLTQPQLYVVPDLEVSESGEPFLPMPVDEMIVNLQLSRGVVEALLESLPRMFSKSALGGMCTGAGSQSYLPYHGKACHCSTRPCHCSTDPCYCRVDDMTVKWADAQSHCPHHGKACHCSTGPVTVRCICHYDMHLSL